MNIIAAPRARVNRLFVFAQLERLAGAAQRIDLLRTCSYGPLSLKQTSRLFQISSEPYRMHYVWVPGTYIRMYRDRDRVKHILANHVAINFPWRPSPFANKAAGCCMLISSLLCLLVKHIFQPDLAIAYERSAII